MDLIKEQIKVEEVSTKQTKNGSMMTKMKTESGKTFNVFHTKKDGDETKAYSVLKRLEGSGLGKTLEVMYKEDPIEVDGKQLKTRTIVLINVNDQSDSQTQQSTTTSEKKVDNVQEELGGESINVDEIPF